MKKITAKFNSKCAETGATIKKGDPMLYDYNTRKCYSQHSAKFKEQDSPQQDYIQDPGEIYFDNWCQRNGI